VPRIARGLVVFSVGVNEGTPMHVPNAERASSGAARGGILVMLMDCDWLMASCFRYGFGGSACPPQRARIKPLVETFVKITLL
jgi:hypothetical protein